MLTNHLVLVQGHCLFGCVTVSASAGNVNEETAFKLFVPRYCCRHNITVGNGYISTDC